MDGAYEWTDYQLPFAFFVIIRASKKINSQFGKKDVKKWHLKLKAFICERILLVLDLAITNFLMSSCLFLNDILSGFHYFDEISF